jgi:ABC-type spermidine/putrescine transport system permease subunit II
MRDGGFHLAVWFGRVLAGLALLAMLAPFLYAAWMSFAPGELLEPPRDHWSLRWYREFLGSPKWTSALAATGVVALLSGVGSLVGGLGLALAVTRYHFRGRQVFSAAVLLPLFVPPTVLAMGLLPLVLWLNLWETPVALAAAHSLVTLPVVYLVLRSALLETNVELERAARGLGAGAWYAFRRVTLPLILPAILAGAVVALILSVNEFTLSLFLSSPRFRTLPAALWPEARYKDTPILAAASCLTVLATVVGMVLAVWVGRFFKPAGEKGRFEKPAYG